MRDMHLYAYFTEREISECNCGWKSKAKTSEDAQRLHKDHVAVMEAMWQAELTPPKPEVVPPVKPTSDPHLNEVLAAFNAPHPTDEIFNQV